MKPLLNTLFVTSQGTWLSREGETVCIKNDERTTHIPIHTLSGIVCFGHVSCTPPLMGLACERGVSLSFLTEHGRFLARVYGPVSGNVLLRRAQFRKSEEPGLRLEVARTIVLGKIANSRSVVVRARREGDCNGNVDRVSAAALRLSHVIEEVSRTDDIDLVRGLEGEAARCYFSVFDLMITGDKESFHFSGRSRRPPLDNVNALLSFVYTLLVHDIQGALETVGLDPAVGFLHTLRPGRPSLALDLMEELRPTLADRLVLTLINRKQVCSSGFRQTETGGVVMDDETRRDVIGAWQKRKQEEILHPFLNERIPIGLLPYVQATLLARHLRGDLDGYPCLLWR